MKVRKREDAAASKGDIRHEIRVRRAHSDAIGTPVAAVGVRRNTAN